MKLIYTLLTITLLTACKKDNPPPVNNDNNNPIIPAPVPTVTLNTHFYGLIDGVPLELTQNVQGYNGSVAHDYILLPSPSYSSAVYRYMMSSLSYSRAIQIRLGSIFWDRGVSTDPTETQFDLFFGSNLTPNYSADGLNGFELEYTDNSGAIWRSSASSVNAQDIIFSNVSNDTDTSGHYTLFTANFNCYVYNATLTDSVRIENAQLTGWFKK